MTDAGDVYVRPSARRHDQFRTFMCERAVLHRADGSARWTQDRTSVLAAVYGPRQAGIRKEDAEKAVCEVIIRPRAGLPGPLEHEMEHTIRRVMGTVVLCAMHPRTSISVIVQVIQDDGALLSCAMNAVCAALVDAAVPMSTLFGSVSCGIMPGSCVVLDPDAKEETEAVAVATFAYTYHHEQPAEKGKAPRLVVSADVLACATEGPMDSPAFFQLASICRAGVQKVGAMMRSSLVKTFLLKREV